ncbi:cytochrome c oxidase assembly protein [Amnibacterium sp. CER49]|uniref:cytochrome c oxidase assembly protein n=1 Tax=Amnibacterium sp. CER49 TaxID=3039161 RepID=UPI002446CA6F|nr:cytochrome c oxidase assembly protein [Amnibacterium sp. CER49]MDH2443663.1 cytochrome c oxidase assembly protein [Amnibacterium sp. CER49]
MNRAARVASPALLTAAALVSLLAALAIGGGAAPQAVSDPGAIVRYGQPVAQLLVNLAASLAVGPLVVAVFALSPRDPRWNGLLDTAAASAAVWTVAAAATGFFSFLSESAPLTVTSPDFGSQFLFFLTSIAVGQCWLATTLAAALLTALVIAVRSHTGAAVLAVLALAALVPMALTGHAANAPGDHGNAIIAFGLHIAGAAVWVGGLVAVVLLAARAGGRGLADLVTRYSALALICFLVVSITGVLSAAIRLGTWRNLLTAYGSLIVVKTLALLAAGAFGAVQRLVLIPRLAGARALKPFLAFVAGELVVLGVASGFAAALSLSAPPDLPVPTLASPAEILTGLPLPPPMTALTLLTQWHLDVLWALICAFLLVLYPLGVLRLRRRGDRWPVGRTICWTAGVIVLFFLTNGGLATYEEFLFSAHMLLHMTLTMVVPLLLVPAAPVTLALRAIPARKDGTRGPREWLLLLVHSRVANLLANPVVAAVLFAGSLVVFYYSPLFSWSATDHLGHEWMTAHFLITGYLFVQALIGVDPVPRAPFPFRLIVLLATMAFHAFFGLSLIEGDGLLLSGWYGAMGWGTSALSDQQTGGGIAWSVGEIPTLVLAIGVAVTWARSDEREGRRRDRAADRSGDAELQAYNDMLANLERGRA